MVHPTKWERRFKRALNSIYETISLFLGESYCLRAFDHFIQKIFMKTPIYLTENCKNVKNQCLKQIWLLDHNRQNY